METLFPELLQLQLQSENLQKEEARLPQFDNEALFVGVEKLKLNYKTSVFEKSSLPSVELELEESNYPGRNPNYVAPTSTSTTGMPAPILLNGLDKFYSDARFSGIDGKGQTVVIMDAGVNIYDVSNPLFGGDDNKNGIADRFENTKYLMNETGLKPGNNSHGNSVASIVANIARGADLIGVQSNLTSYVETIADWMSMNRNDFDITTANFSMGDGKNYTTDFSEKDPTSLTYQPMFTELQYLEKNGVRFNAAAGNYYEYYKAEGMGSPAAFHTTTGVMAVNPNSSGKGFGSTLASYSQRRDDAIAAPTNLMGLGGTSAATPFVTGASALLQGVAEKYLNRNLEADELEGIIKKTSTPVAGTAGGKYDQIDVWKAADYITGMTPTESIDVIRNKTLINPASYTITDHNFNNSNTLNPNLKNLYKISGNSITINERIGLKLDIKDFTVKDDTLLRFDYYNNNQRSLGEYASIGFDNNTNQADNGQNDLFLLDSPLTLYNDLNTNPEFQVTRGTSHKVEIPVGQLLEGGYSYLTLHAGTGVTTFSNIELANI